MIYKNICIFDEMFYTPENIKKVHNIFQIGCIYAPLSVKRCIFKRVMPHPKRPHDRQ